MNDRKIVILDGATLGEDMDLSLFEAFGKTEIYPITPAENIQERIKDADIVIINKIKMNKAVLEGNTKLKLICEAATGYDNIDIEYCKGNNIAVCNVAGYSVNSVSQLTLAMVLSASVSLYEYRESVVSGKYSKGNVQNILTPVYHELCGKTWGIIGYGAIGKKVGDAAEALGCRVIANKRTPIDSVECVPLEKLLKESDIITVHTPLTEETKGLIGEKEIAMMKEGVFIVNAARGAVFDERATAEAIKNGKIGFFGCDVYSTEPMPFEHPYFDIRDYKNVCLTPHMAWGAYESRERCLKEIAKNIESFYSGGSRNRIV